MPSSEDGEVGSGFERVGVNTQTLDNLLQFLPPLRDWLSPLLARLPGNQDVLVNVVFGDRFLVCFFLPLVPVLFLWPQRYLRWGILFTTIVFLGYVFGAWYPVFWLGLCAGFYFLSERFASEVRRTDVWRGGPFVAVVLCLLAGYAGPMLLAHVGFSQATSQALYERFPWLFPVWMRTEGGVGRHPQVFGVLSAVQLNGVLILTIRMIHYFSELKREAIPRAERTLLNFLAFAGFGPTLMQGPVERWGPFQEALARSHERRRAGDLVSGLGRIGLGLGKHAFCLLVLGPMLYRLVYEQHFLDDPARVKNYATLFFGLHGMVLHLYLEFSGYCDVAVGTARLLGVRVSENFDRPWRSLSLTEMWRRWHITLSFICRDYIFMPLVRRRWNVVLALVVTFLVVGALHNFAIPYFVWGVVMGLMVAVNQKWTRWMRSLDHRPERTWSRLRRAWLRLQPLPRACAWLLTINAFVFSALALLWQPSGEWAGGRVAWELIRRPLAALAAAVGLDGFPAG